MKVLITGFDPFGGESINPALEAVKALPDTIAGAEIIKLEIPTVFRKSLEKIEENIIKHSPDITIFEDGETAYFTNLPIKAMVKEMQDGGIPASVSNTAGTFVCNHVMYGIMYMIDKKYPNIKGGFIHVPYIPSQVVTKPNMPSMSASDITKGLELCIKAAIENNEDVKVVGGEIC